MRKRGIFWALTVVLLVLAGRFFLVSLPVGKLAIVPVSVAKATQVGITLPPAALVAATAAGNPSLRTVSVFPASNASVRAVPGRLADPQYRQQRVAELLGRQRQAKTMAWGKARREGWPAVMLDANGEKQTELMAILNGRVYQHAVFNYNGAITVGADLIRQVPPDFLSGSNLTVGVWDAGSARTTHQELTPRVVVRDGSAMHSHSTHISGTIAARGVVAQAKGMAPAVNVDAYDWNDDLAEMTSRAMADPSETNRINISNHSYGFLTGWYNYSYWYGTYGLPEAEGFGLYDETARDLDALCVEAPYYLPFKAAGNDRADGEPLAGQTFYYYTDADGWVAKLYDPATDPPPDFWDQGGYDTIGYDANAKNIMTVGGIGGAVVDGRRSPATAAMSYFSSWGPSDDGRVKPDIVAHSEDVYSSESGSDSQYGTSTGTSMATANASGAAILLVDLFGKLFPGQFMRASTLKALLLHTADDLGNPGPDYQFGWGLMNVKAAADLLRLQCASTNAFRLREDVLADSADVRTYDIEWDRRSPLKVTLCWTDLPGDAHDGLDDRRPNLVHDLDLRVADSNGRLYLPYVLDPLNPAAVASNGDNEVDNVEQVYIAAPPLAGFYRVSVRSKNGLAAPQPFSLVVGGSAAPPLFEHTPLANTTNEVGPYVVRARLTSELALLTNTITMHWRASPSGVYSNVPMALATGGVYVAAIPGFPRGTRIQYYLIAMATNGITGATPPDAPGQVWSFDVTAPVDLVVTGRPAMVAGNVAPAYGTTTVASGVAVHASADAWTSPSGGRRYHCMGWAGTGSVPPSGGSNAVDFIMTQDSTLEWQWAEYVELVNDASPGSVLGSSWWAVGSMATTFTAVATTLLDGREYDFIGWYADGVTRLPDAASEAANPAVLLMARPRHAVAMYMDTAVDDDSDGMADAWEFRYFGGLSAGPFEDADHDGFANRIEFLDGSDPRDPLSVPHGPSIAHTPLAALQSAPGPWLVTAVVTDNTAVRDVFLEWRLNGGAVMRVAMVTGTNHVYAGVLAAGVSGDQLQYEIVATDLAGMESRNGPYVLSIAYPVAVLTPDSFGTNSLSHSQGTRLYLSISNAGNSDLVWTFEPAAAGVSNDVESGTNGWTHGGSNDVWHISQRRAWSGASSWCFGNESDGYYPPDARASLVSPLFIAPPGAMFSFRQWLETEALRDATNAWDGGIIEISTNNGATFTQITPVGGYPYHIWGHPASGFPDQTPCFAGTGGWQAVACDLSAFAGQAVRLRFRFGSDSYEEMEGWYVDDIRVSPYGGPMDWMHAVFTNGVVAGRSMERQMLTISTSTLAPGETRQGGMVTWLNDPVRPVAVTPCVLRDLGLLITVTWTGHGRVSPSGGVVVTAGTTTNFVATADLYCYVSGIQTNGSAVGAAGIGSSEVVWTWTNVQASGEFHADFAPHMTGGVALAWLAGYGLTNFSEGTLNGDPDGDGMSTRAEYEAGTNPTNGASRLAFDAVQLWDDGRLILQWPAAGQQRYAVYDSARPDGTFLPVMTNLVGTPPLNVFTGQWLNSGPRFYRLGVERVSF